MHLLWRIQRYLKQSGMAPTRFGRIVVNDPRFVGDLINGRQPSDRTERRVETWLAEQGMRS